MSHAVYRWNEGQSWPRISFSVFPANKAKEAFRLISHSVLNPANSSTLTVYQAEAHLAVRPGGTLTPGEKPRFPTRVFWI